MILDRRRRTPWSLALIVMSIGRSDGFVMHSKRQRAQISTSVYYKSESHASIDTIPQNVATDLIENSFQQPIATPASKDLPWFRKERSHLLEENLRKLGDAMVKRMYTENEVLKLYFAIEEASLGDRNIMSRAAEFCLILAETMDMGLNTLIAAAFHYTWCMSSEEEASSMAPWDISSLSAWDMKEQKGGKMFGDQVVEIMKDASRLKKLEATFSSIVRNPHNKARASLASKDGENLRKLLLTDARDWRALAIRAAAALYRLRSIEEEGHNRLSSEAVQTSREALFIFAPLASGLGMQKLKNELEGTAFRVLYRRQYAAVTSFLPSHSKQRFGKDFKRIRKTMRRVLRSSKELIETLLNDDFILSCGVENVEVTTRVKEPYSTWKKMLRQGAKNILDVPDALALRVIIKGKKLSPEEPNEVTQARERAFCHYVRDRCMDAIPALEDNPRLRDYIENPKPNGYQSLHYTGNMEWEDEDWNVELQIRSEEMHKVAEYGLASHWEYKLLNGMSGRQSSSDSSRKTEKFSSNAYLKYLQEWHWEQKSGTINWETSLLPPDDNKVAFLKDDVERKIRDNFRRDRMKHLEPYLVSLKEAKLDLTLKHVFVFVSSTEGTDNLIALPSNARVVDALQEVTDMNHFNGKTRTTLLNGSVVSLEKRLKNGDVLTLSKEMERETVGALRM